MIAVKGRAQAAWTSQLDHGKVQGFPSYNQAQSLLTGWLQQYPQLLSRERIGTSIEGRPIHVYVAGAGADRLLDNPPEVLLTSLMHAREPTSLTVLLYFLGHLLEQYMQEDADAVYVLQARLLCFVPFVNPDGYVANEGLAQKVIRKNRRHTCSDATAGGVDLNRNFGFHWSPDFQPCGEEYQGKAPFSEPETQALKKLIEAHNFRAAVNFHSFGGMLTHPFNFGKKSLPADDQKVYDEIAAVFKWPLFGPAIKTVGYTAPGESDDWMYAAHHIISMSPEVGPEEGDFWPPPNMVAGIDSRNYDRALYVVKKAGLELAVSWIHSPGASASANLPRDVRDQLQLVGGLPASVLQLRLYNKGLGKSAGEALNVAVSGATGANLHSMTPGAAVVLLGDGPTAQHAVARLVPDVASERSAPILAFQVPPLERRSSSLSQLILGRSLEATWPKRFLNLCVVEMPRAADELPPGAMAVCQCIGPAQMPAPTDAAPATFASSSPAALVRFVGPDATDELGKLCSAAVAAATPETTTTTTTTVTTATRAVTTKPVASLAPSPQTGPAPMPRPVAPSVWPTATVPPTSSSNEVPPGSEGPGKNSTSEQATSSSSSGFGVGFFIIFIVALSALLVACFVAYVFRRRHARSLPQASSIDGERVPALRVPAELDDGGLEDIDLDDDSSYKI